MFNNILLKQTWQYDIQVQNFLNNQLRPAQGCLYTLLETCTENQKPNASVKRVPNVIMLRNELNQK